MSYEDFLEKKRNHNDHNSHYGHHSFYEDDEFSGHPVYSHASHERSPGIFILLQKIRANKKLRLLVIALGLLLLAIIACLLMILAPLLLQLIDYIRENGIQGVISEVTSFLDKLWKGATK